MRVLHVAAYFAPAWGYGGPPRSLLALCQAQRDAGIDIEVFTTTADVKDELSAAPDGIDIEGVTVRRFVRDSPRWMFGASSMEQPLIAAAQSADVVHIHGLFNRTVWMGARAARTAGVPFVVSPRGMLEPAALAHHWLRKRAAWRLFDRQIVQRAAMLHASSAAEQATLLAHSTPDRITEIPHGVQLAPRGVVTRAALAAHIDLADGVPYVLFLGRLHRIKRLDLLVDAFRITAAAHPALHLVIAGPDEQRLRPALEARLGQFRSRVRWPGPVEGVVKTALLEDALTVVLCSDAESFGLVAAEALAAGTPPVVTHTCPWTLLEDDACGQWVAQTPVAIGGAIERLLVLPALRRQLGERARDVAARRFAWDRVARTFRDAYATLAPPRQSSVA
jgi:glycosyltransferase involved in cell wall biosynthesis